MLHKKHVLASAMALACSLPVFAQNKVGDPVIVTATRQPQRINETLTQVDVISREDIENAGQSSLVDLLQSRSGIRVSTNGGPGSVSSVFIRGAESRHTLILIDGVRFSSATTGQAALENIPLEIIDHIEIVRGPASAVYGSEAIGGVIQVFTRKGTQGFHPEFYAGYGSNHTIKTSASLAAGVERLRYNITVGQDSAHGFNAKNNIPAWYSAWGNSYNPDDDGYRNSYMSASATLGFRERDEIGFDMFYTKNRNWYDVNDYYDSYMNKRTATYGVHMKNALTDHWDSTLRLSRGEDRVNSTDDLFSFSRFKTTQTQLLWQNDIRLSLGTLMAGYEYVKTKVSGTGNYTRDHRDVNAFMLGWSAQWNRHSWQINARHDDNSQFGHRSTGSLAYGYQLTPQWNLHGSIGTAFNAPTFNQLYWPDTGFGGGSPDLKPEKAVSREVGMRWDNGQHNVDVTYYNNRIRDLISSWPPANVARAKMEGVELAYSTILAGFDISAGMDFLKAEDRDTGKKLPRRSNAAAFGRISRDMGVWRWGVEWDGERGRYDDEANQVRMGGYGQLNAFAHYRFAKDWRLEVRGNNLLDKDYELARGYATAGRIVFAAVRYTPR